MDVKDIIEIIERGEDSKHQFKENITNANSLATEMVAFSNLAGGILLIGVNDRGEIIGLTKEDIHRLNQLISNAASQHVKSPINPTTEIVKVNDKRLIVLSIFDGIDKPYMDNSGAIWVKSGADKRKVTSREELRRLFQSSDLVHSDEIPVNGSSINDIDKDYFKEYYLKEFDENLNDVNLPLIQVFNNLNLAKDNLLNLAGLLLFGENPQRLKPTFVIKAISFLGNEVTGNKYRDSEDMGGKLTNQYKNGISFLKRNLKKLQGDKGVNSLGDLEVPEVVLEELLVNALIHRNYFISAPIRLFIFDNRLEMISPGILPNKLTIENIKNGNSIIRNPILTSFGTKELPYRGIGTGIRRALKNYKEIDLVNDTQNELFKVIIRRPAVL